MIFGFDQEIWNEKRVESIEKLFQTIQLLIGCFLEIIQTRLIVCRVSALFDNISMGLKLPLFWESKVK